MKLRFTLIAALAVVGCSNDDNNVGPPVDPGPVEDMAMDDVGVDLAHDVNILPDVPAEPGSLVIDPTSITFSDVRQGESATATIAFANVGGSPIVVTGVQLIEVNRIGEPEFRTGDPWAASFVVGPNLFRELQVVYEPNDFDVDQARLELFTNDPDHEIVQIRIETVSAYAQLEGPQILRFGEVGAGESLTKRITFYNRGLDALTVDSVDLGGITGTFSIAFGPNATPPTVMERDEDFVVDVTYEPDAAETHRGTVTLNSDAPGQPTFEVALVGNDPTPCLDLTPDLADFGEVAAATPQSQQVTMLNCSQTLNLEVSSIELTDDGQGVFALGDLPTLPLQLAPLQTAQFTVTGNLQAPGIATGEVEVSSTDTSSDGKLGLRLTVPNP